MDKKDKIDSRPQSAPTYGLLQLMPRGRVRLDPSTVMSVAAWVVAYSQKWERECVKSGIGLSPDEWRVYEARKRWYRSALSAMACLLGSLTDTLAVAEIELAKAEIEAALRAKCEVGFDPLKYATLQTSPEPK